MNIVSPYILVFLATAILLLFAGANRFAECTDGRISLYRANWSGWIAVLLAVALLGAFYGFRSYSVGVDTYTYITKLSSGFEALVGENGAVGYALVVAILETVFPDNYTVVLLFFGVVTSACLLIPLIRLCPDPFFGIVVISAFGYLFEGVNQFRQLAAMSVIMLSVVYLTQGKVKRFVLIVLLAASIHPSAIVFLLVLALRKLDYSDTALLVVAVFTVLATFAVPYFRGMLSSIPVFGVYVGTGFDREADANSILNFIFRLCLFLFVIARRNRLEEKFEWSRTLLSIVMLGTIFQALSLNFSMFSRISSYFILIPAVLSTISNGRGRLFVSVIMLVLFLTLFYVNSATKFAIPHYSYQLVWDADIELRV